MNQKDIIAVLVVIVIILLGTTVYYATLSKVNEPIAIAPMTQQPSTPPANKTADWKEYSSVNFGISFKYPRNYVFMDRSNNAEKAILIGDKNFPNPEIAPSYHAPITISKYDEKLLNDQISTLFNTKKTTMTIDGENANVIEGNYQNYPAPNIPADKHIKIITIPGKNITITARDYYTGTESDWNEISSVVDSLLATIEFTRDKITQEIKEFCEEYDTPKCLPIESSEFIDINDKFIVIKVNNSINYLLTKKGNDWRVSIASEENNICDTGSDSPDLVEYCRSLRK
ncbi:MAG: hypothetical protein V3574_00600 [Candidatus Moraniibacteriota bacterium]